MKNFQWKASLVSCIMHLAFVMGVIMLEIRILLATYVEELRDVLRLIEQYVDKKYIYK